MREFGGDRRGSPWRACCRRPMLVEIALSEPVASVKLIEVRSRWAWCASSVARPGAAACGGRAGADPMLVELGGSRSRSTWAWCATDAS